MRLRSLFSIPFCTGLLAAFPAFSAEPADSRQAILSMAGCYLVDYSYVETQALQPGYSLDPRVYDVNRSKTVKEWIFAQEVSPRSIRLQHVLFFAGADGQVAPESFLKHQAEDWDYEADYLYEFIEPGHWEPREGIAAGSWVRRITNLDDGLRYQCAAPWNLRGAYPEWSCQAFAPIPGRETRDMGRKDYNTLERATRLIAYGNSFLERQDNVKTVLSGAEKKPLARETGRNWYVRLPDSECAAAREWAAPRLAFWEVLRLTWKEIFDEKKPFREPQVKGLPPRFARMSGLEEKYMDVLAGDREAAALASREIKKLISEYREP